MPRPVRMRIRPGSLLKMPDHINPKVKTAPAKRRTDKTHGMNDDYFEKFVDAGVELQKAGVCNDDTLAMLAMLKTVDRETLHAVELAIARAGKKNVRLAVRGL